MKIVRNHAHFSVAPFSQELESPENPGRFNQPLSWAPIFPISRSTQIRSSLFDATSGNEYAMTRYTLLRRIFETFAGSSQSSLYTRSNSVSSPMRTGHKQ